MTRKLVEFLQRVYALCSAITSRPEGAPPDILEAAEEIERDLDEMFDEIRESEGGNPENN